MSENAKTIIVDIRAGDRIDRQVYDADNWLAREDGGREITRKDGPLNVRIAEFAPGQWLSVRQGDALAPDVTARKFDIAKRALLDILRELGDDPGEPDTTLGKIETLTADAINAICAETE